MRRSWCFRKQSQGTLGSAGFRGRTILLDSSLRPASCLLLSGSPMGLTKPFPHFPSADFPNGPLHFVKVISLVSWENGGGQSLAGKRVTTSSSEGAKKVTVCGLCQRLWCNCSHQGWIQACGVTDWAPGRHTHMSRAPLARAAPWGPLARWTPQSSGEERSRQRNGECPPEASR